jgi:hypothetical protein
MICLGTVQRMGGSCSLGLPLVLICIWIEQLAKLRAERSVKTVQRAWSKRSAPCRDHRICCDFVHAPIDEKVGGSLGDRSSDTKAGDKPQWRWVSPGAITATILWIVASIGFTIYVANFNSYAEPTARLAV